MKKNETPPVPEDLLNLIPRNTENLCVVGKGAGQLLKSFSSFSSCVQGQEFLSGSDFLSGGIRDLDGLALLSGEEKTDFPALFKEAKKSLKPKGALILQIPNPFCFGALESTDTRLETLPAKIQNWHSSLRKEAEKNGFHIDRQRWPGVKEPNGNNRLTRETRGLPKFVMDSLHAPLLYLRFLMYKPEPLHFQAQVLKPVGGVNDVRITEPLAALATLPGVTAAISRNIPGKPVMDVERKIMILHRPILSLDNSLDAIKILREQGYLILTEFDDHYSPWPGIEQNSFLSFAGVHAVQTTTPTLAEVLKEFNPEIGIFPNQLAALPDEEEKNPAEKVRVFFGALNREKDWAPLIPALNSMLKEIGSRIEFEIVFDQTFFKALETDQKNFTPQCPYDVYKSKLAGADIALMPLQDTLFNRMKSDLKFVEAAGFGAVPVASPVVYENCDPSGDFSILCKQPDDFANAIRKLVMDRGKLQKMQERARHYVRDNRLLCAHLAHRQNWYEDLLKRRAELDQALERRLKAIIP